MDGIDYENTTVLEKLSSRNLLNNFFDAIETDDFLQMNMLLLEAEVDVETIRVVLHLIAEAA